MHLPRRLLPLAAAVLVAAGCSDSAPDASPDGGPAASEEVAADDYEFLFMTAVRSDTLRGTARFGVVLNRRLDANELVIQLDAGGGYGGGLYLVRRDTTLPRPGAYDLAGGAPGAEGGGSGEGGAPTDAEMRANPGRFEIIYQAGLGTQLNATGGRVTFETVTDTLIVATFEATLRGTVARGGVDDPLSEARVRGRFRADRGAIGYMIGL